MSRIVIAGGGLIGLCSAYWLLRDGHRVTIVEREHLGAGAATGNAGELTPQMVAPLASPNTARDILAGVFTNRHYLSIDPLRLPNLARFGLGFLAASLPARLARGEAALAQLLKHMLPALHDMGRDGIDISGGGEGFLMTAETEDALLAAHATFTERARRGWAVAPGEPLAGAELRAAEPTLTEATRFGFHLPGEYFLDPVTFVSSLAQRVQELGAEVVTGVTVRRLGRGASVVGEDARGEQVKIGGDRVLLATGAHTSAVLRRSGVRAASVVAGKGYSFTVPVARIPRTVVHSLDRHCVAIPMHGRLRIVGMMEFDGHPERFNPQRMRVLVGLARGVIDGADWDARTDEWVGPRPMTADGLPLIGPVPGHPRALVATGHNMHGLSLGPLTGLIVRDLVAGRSPGADGWPFDLRPFRVRR